MISFIFIRSFELVLQGLISAARTRIKHTPVGNTQLSLMDNIHIIIIRSIHAVMMGQQYHKLINLQSQPAVIAASLYFILEFNVCL